MLTGDRRVKRLFMFQMDNLKGINTILYITNRNTYLARKLFN